MARDDDQRLLRDCLAGRPRAWEAFVRRFTPYLAGVCRRALARCALPSGPQETDDMLQEVFLKLLAEDLKILRAYRGEAAPEAYLAAVAVHRVSREGNLPGLAPAAVSEDPSPPAALEAKDGRERLRAGMDSLPPMSRLALALHADGRSLREIGLTLGISKDAVAGLLERAKADLRKHLE